MSGMLASNPEAVRAVAGACNRFYRGVALLLALGLTACAQFGPRTIEASRTDYNVAMSQTENEQMLLNLVRLRYGDRPYFLEVSALNTQFLIAPSAGISSSFDLDGTTNYGIDGKFAFEEKPTVTYTPLQGEKFVKRVLSRVPLDTLLLLDASGWKTSRVLRLCVETMNSLDNAASASGPTPSAGPDVAAFRRAVNLLTGFQENRAVALFHTGDSERGGYAVRFDEQVQQGTDFQEFARLLQLDPAQKRYALGEASFGGDSDTIRLGTRSFMGVMYFLSNAIEIPAADRDDGRVRQTAGADGGEFDWDSVTGDLLRVKSQETRPASAAVAVNYRGHWFYIDDSDIDSKSTFALLGQLFALQSDADKTGAPVLTLPVGG